MADEACGYLIGQFETAWKLTTLHLDGLTTEECLWRPAARGLHVHRGAEGRWLADWPDRESYDLGPASIAWLSWHLGFWWSMVLDHSFGEATLERENVTWPGEAEAVRRWITGLRDRWWSRLEVLTDRDLQATHRTRWPFRQRPFGDVVAWVNLELTKNAAEIGYVRFLHAVRNANEEC